MTHFDDNADLDLMGASQLTDKFEVVQSGSRDDNPGDGGDAGMLVGSGPSQRNAGRSSASRSIYT